MKKLSFLLLISLLVLQLGCSSTTESKQIKVSPDYAVAENLSDMVENAETIVIGSFQKYSHSFNAERNPKNENEESKESYSETKVYEFEVEETLKGNSPRSSIQVSIPYSKELTGLIDEQGQEIRFRVPSLAHVQPKIGKKYVLFLIKNERTNMYQAPFTPYMIEIKDDNKVVLQKPQSEMKTSFKTKSNDQYNVSVEGVHLKKDQISGKDLSELKEEMRDKIDK